MSTLAIPVLARPFDRTVRVPGSKSITNRAVLLGALAAGRSEIRGALAADDTEAMIDVAVELGATVAHRGDTITVDGIAGLLPSSGAVFARRSGTTARFIAPILALAPGPWVLDGDAQLAARPMEDLYRALESVGANVVRDRAGRSMPVEIRGSIAGGEVEVPGGTTSQFLSGLLLAGPLAPQGLIVHVRGDLKSRPYVELTVGVMRDFGAVVGAEKDVFTVEPGAYRGRELTVEPDASTASYFYAAAAISRSRVRVAGLGYMSVQGDIRFVEYLRAMGAHVDTSGAEIVVEGTGELRGITLDASDTPDVVPTLAIVASLASTPTVISGVGFTRGHESDRVGGLVTELVRCGIDAHEEADGLVIGPSQPHGALVTTSGDHRMAMTFATLGLVVPGVAIDDPGCVAKTFPGFFSTLDSLRS
jgi:3-phosphoshikimate 1-carboxyvinyltransferase